jgi:hypothetical protein
MKNEKSKIKGNNYEVKYKFTDKKGITNEDSQTIFAKNEDEAIEEVQNYISSLGVALIQDNFEILECNLISDESKKKCFKVTYTWEDDKGNVSKLSEKVFAKDPEQAKKMVIDYTQKRHKFMVAVIIKQVDEIIDGKEELVENLEGNEKLITKAHDKPEKREEKIPDHVRQAHFDVTLGKKVIDEKNGIPILKFEVHVAGSSVNQVVSDLSKFKSSEGLTMTITPFQLTMTEDAPKEKPQMTIDDLPDEAEAAMENDIAETTGEDEPLKYNSLEEELEAEAQEEEQVRAEEAAKIIDAPDHTRLDVQDPVNSVICDPDPLGVEETEDVAVQA